MHRDLEDLQKLISDLPVAVYVCEAPTGVIRLYNRRAVELWGREPKLGDVDEKFCGSLRLFRPDGRPLPHHQTPMAEVLRGGAARSEEVEIERPDGTRVRVQVSITPLLDSEGRLTGAVNVFQDITHRTAAEEALRLSESRYRAIVEDQPEMVCRFLADGTMTFANQAYCRYFGLRREEVIGTQYQPVIHPADRTQVQAQLAAMSPASPVAIIENRVFRSDGAVRWTLWTNRALYDDLGRLRELQSTGRDVTDQRKAEEDSARLAAIVAGAEDAILSKTLEGIITSWNRASEILFGFSASDVLGQPISKIVPPDRLEEEEEILARLERGEMIDHFETERLRKDGRRVPVSLAVSPVRDAGGGIIGLSTIARDISDRLRTEENLKNTVQTLEVLYRLADLMGRAHGRKEICEAAVEAVMAVAAADRASVLLFDETGVMRFTAWRGLSDRYRAAIDGHSPWTPDAEEPSPILVEDVLEEPGLAALREVIAGEGIRSLAFIPLYHRDRLLGKFMIYYDAPHEFSAEELRLAATIAQHVGFGLTRVDAAAEISNLLERERAARMDADTARAEAERANRAKDEFLAMLAHELRNPLSVIVNSIAVIDRVGKLEAEPQRASEMIGRQAGHLARLLDDLLDVARITSGRMELVREPVDFRTAAEQALDGHRHGLENKRQLVTLSWPDRPVLVLGDRVRLQQVVGNLVNNASKYTPPGGSIHVVLEVRGGEGVLRVRDDGTGIPADMLESIFEPFAQANPTLARTEGGLGIGLTLVKRVVELHGGSVSAFSEGTGRGTELTVRLPLALEAEPTLEADPVAPVAFAARRILIVEDHEDGREILATTLRGYGHRVFEAATGWEGVEAAARETPDVVLVDIGLPDIEGYRVGEEIRQRLGAGVRLVALTGYGQGKDRERSAAAGFDAHLVKPVDPPTLMAILDGLVLKGGGLTPSA